MVEVEPLTSNTSPPRALQALVFGWLLSVAALIFIALQPDLLASFDSSVAQGLAKIGLTGDQFANTTQKITLRLLTLAVGILPVFSLELWIAGYANSSVGRLLERRSMSAKYDVGFFLILFCGLTKVWHLGGTLGLTYFVGLAGNTFLSHVGDGHWQIDTGMPWLNMSLYIVAFTFFDYWNHRIFHMRPFWFLHRMHHSASEMVTFTLYRDHPGTTLFEPVFKAWPLAFFAVPSGYVMTFLTIALAYELMIHSNLPWTWGWFGRWVLTPPLGHRLHHSADKLASQKLLAATPIWDRLFGTWAPVRAEMVNLPLGVMGANYNTGNIVREIGFDFVAFGRALLGMPQRKAVARQA